MGVRCIRFLVLNDIREAGGGAWHCLRTALAPCSVAAALRVRGRDHTDVKLCGLLIDVSAAATCYTCKYTSPKDYYGQSLVVRTAYLAKCCEVNTVIAT